MLQQNLYLELLLSTVQCKNGYRNALTNYCPFFVCRREERQKKHDEIRKKYGNRILSHFTVPQES